MDADQVATLRALLANTDWLERVRLFGRTLRVSTRVPGGLLVVGTPKSEPWHLTAHLDEESRLAGIPELMPTLVRWAPPPGAPPHLRVGLSRLEEARRGETLFVVSAQAAPAPLLERVNDARHVGATILALGADDPELDALAHEALCLPGGRPPGDPPRMGGLPVPPYPPGPPMPPGPPIPRGAPGTGGLAAPIPPGPPRTGGSAAPMPLGLTELAGRAGLLNFDAAQHLVSAAAGSRDDGFAGGARNSARGIRALRGRVARLLDVVSGPSA